MNSEEAKFVLRAYRAQGDGTAAHPHFDEALARARTDPELMNWMAAEQKLDEVISAKLDSVALPAGLREHILLGVREGRRSRRRWHVPTMFAIAAVLAVMVALPIFRRRDQGVSVASVTRPDALAEFALENLAHGPHGHSSDPSVRRMAAELSDCDTGLISLANRVASEASMRTAGCQSFEIGGRRVFEICFEHSGGWCHLYVVEVGGDDDRAVRVAGGAPLLVEREGLAVAAWKSGGAIYALVTRSGMAALKKMI